MSKIKSFQLLQKHLSAAYGIRFADSDMQEYRSLNSLNTSTLRVRAKRTIDT